jgi:hypothetical protein
VQIPNKKNKKNGSSFKKSNSIIIYYLFLKLLFNQNSLISIINLIVILKITLLLKEHKKKTYNITCFKVVPRRLVKTVYFEKNKNKGSHHSYERVTKKKISSIGWTNLTPHELVRVSNWAYRRIPSRIRKFFER